MTNEEILKHIEQNCRYEDGSPAMDEQAFYEGAKWMRDKALSLYNVSDCDHWTCEKCGKVPNEEVTYEETHDGCGGHCS